MWLSISYIELLASVLGACISVSLGPGKLFYSGDIRDKEPINKYFPPEKCAHPTHWNEGPGFPQPAGSPRECHGEGRAAGPVPVHAEGTSLSSGRATPRTGLPRARLEDGSWSTGEVTGQFGPVQTLRPSHLLVESTLSHASGLPIPGSAWTRGHV